MFDDFVANDRLVRRVPELGYNSAILAAKDGFSSFATMKIMYSSMNMMGRGTSIASLSITVITVILLLRLF